MPGTADSKMPTYVALSFALSGESSPRFVLIQRACTKWSNLAGSGSARPVGGRWRHCGWTVEYSREPGSTSPQHKAVFGGRAVFMGQCDGRNGIYHSQIECCPSK